MLAQELRRCEELNKHTPVFLLQLEFANSESVADYFQKMEVRERCSLDVFETFLQQFIAFQLSDYFTGIELLQIINGIRYIWKFPVLR